MLEECKRVEALGLKYLNVHPGSTSGKCSKEESIAQIAKAINFIHSQTSYMTIVLENTAGGGGTVGVDFAELRSIIDKVENKNRIGVCIDTCHAFASGMDLKKKNGIQSIVEEFDKVTYDQFKAALDDLEGQGMNSLIIDLRGNPGGQLTTVTDMLKLFLPEGVIVSTKDKYGNTDEITCDGDHEFKKPLAVLVDGRSASASEIFSAAIQDYGVGTIVGTQTYGKGVVQQTIDLGDGTCMKITISEYYTPSGRSINGTGVTPDVEVEYEYDEDEPERDNQLEKAIDTVNG